MLGTKIFGTELDRTIDTEKLRYVLGAQFAGIEQPPVDATFAISACFLARLRVPQDARPTRRIRFLADLRDGDSIADVARAHEVGVAEAQDAVAAAMRERLDAGVAAGWISQERACQNPRP